MLMLVLTVGMMLALSVFSAINDAIISLKPAAMPRLDAPATPAQKAALATLSPDALAEAKRLAGPDGLVVTTGSLFIVGEVRTIFGLPPGHTRRITEPIKTCTPCRPVRPIRWRRVCKQTRRSYAGSAPARSRS